MSKGVSEQVDGVSESAAGVRMSARRSGEWAQLASLTFGPAKGAVWEHQSRGWVLG